MTHTRHMTRRIAIRFAIALLALGAGCNKKKPDEIVVRITGIPDENPTELQRKYKPLVDFLSKKLGVKVTYVPVTDYGAAVKALEAGKVDFAWLGGFTHVQARSRAKVEALVMRDIDRQFKSVFIAATGAGIATMGDLKGKTFAFGSKSSTSGHLMPRHFMTTKHGIDPDGDLKGKPVYSGAHDATARFVEKGRVQAGVLNKEVWDRLVSGGKVDTSKVAVIWTTPGYVDYNWTARTGLDAGLRDKFRAAFLALDPANAEHKAVLDLQGAKRFVPAANADFDAIEAVGRSTGLLK